MKWFRRKQSPPDDEAAWEQKKVEIRAAKERRFAQTATQRDLVAEVSKILFEADPVGINFEDNTDKYDSEAETIVIGLPKTSSSDDVHGLIYEVFVQWFDPVTAGSREKYAAPAAAIWNLWRRHQAQAGLS